MLRVRWRILMLLRRRHWTRLNRMLLNRTLLNRTLLHGIRVLLHRTGSWIGPGLYRMLLNRVGSGLRRVRLHRMLLRRIGPGLHRVRLNRMLLRRMLLFRV